MRGAQPQTDDSVKAPMRPHHPNLGRYPQGLPYLVRNDQTNDDKHARSTTKLGEKSRRRRATVTQTTRVIPFPAREPRIRFRPPVFPIGHFTLVRRDKVLFTTITTTRYAKASTGSASRFDPSAAHISPASPARSPGFGSVQTNWGANRVPPCALPRSSSGSGLPPRRWVGFAHRFFPHTSASGGCCVAVSINTLRRGAGGNSFNIARTIRCA